MKENKLETISNLFEGKEIRSIWDKEKEEYYFSIVDVINTLAEPFKLWLAKLGRQKVDEVFDPSKGIDEMIDFYLRKGYTLDWIESRIKAIIDRKRLTKIWHDGGVKKGSEYAILTNAIYKEWSGMTASEYKAYKNIRKENLRDNMTDIEVALANIGELTTRDIAKNKHPQGLTENIEVASKENKKIL